MQHISTFIDTDGQDFVAICLEIVAHGPGISHIGCQLEWHVHPSAVVTRKVLENLRALSNVFKVLMPASLFKTSTQINICK